MNVVDSLCWQGLIPNLVQMSMYTEDDLLPLSALQHLLFCERQCALIHIEQLWAENLFTAEGRVLHENVDSGPDFTREGRRIVRSLPLKSLRLGLSGVADVVEFGAPDSPEGVFPVEYKRGRKKKENWDRVQLCAQALCLEEMLETHVPAGAIFYGQPRRREQVEFDASLRAQTEATARRLHELIASGKTPPAEPGEKCAACSLLELCMPRMGGKKSVAAYMAAMTKDI